MTEATKAEPEASAPETTPDPSLLTEQPVDPAFARALAAMQALKKPADESAETEETKAETSPATETPSATEKVQATPAAEKIDPLEEKIDRKFEQLTQRLTKSETDRLTLEQRAKAAELKLAEVMADIEAAEEEPERLFNRVKWNPDKVKNYAENGKRALSPETAKLNKLVEEQAQKLQQLEQQLTQRSAREQVDTFKSNIRQDLKGAADKYPHFFDAFDGDEQAITDAVFGSMHAAYQSEGKTLTAEEVAMTAESHWKGIAERLSKRRTKSETPEQTLATKQTPATTKPKVSTNVPEDADEPQLTDQERRLKDALAVANRIRRETQSA